MTLAAAALGLAVPALGGGAAASAKGSARPAEQWARPNADLGARRVAQTTIDAGNVARLRLAWRFVVPEQPTFSGVLAATPLLLGGKVVMQTLNSNVYALSARSGSIVWSRRFGRASGGPNGLSAGSGRLYGATDTSLFALAPASGATLWLSTLTTPARPINLAPLVWRGLVVTSTTAPDPGGKGVLLAVDADRGGVVWRRSTVARPWANPDAASGGGAWWTPTVDPGGRLYVGIANPRPFGGSAQEPNGAAYAGDALYTDSLLVLRAATGVVDWFDQVTPHDVRDYDFALPPVLVRAGGRELVIGGGKAGVVIAWDRATHRRVWTAPVGLHRNDSGPLPRRFVSVCPGLFGGALTPMASAAGRVFVPVVDLCMRGSATGYEKLGSVVVSRGRGELVALDAASGRRLWLRRFPSPTFGCATIASDVVFTSTYDGTVYALDARTGRTLWTVKEPAGVNACPAVAGDLLVVPAGAEPEGLATPTPVVDGYRLSRRSSDLGAARP